MHFWQVMIEALHSETLILQIHKFRLLLLQTMIDHYCTTEEKLFNFEPNVKVLLSMNARDNIQSMYYNLYYAVYFR